MQTGAYLVPITWSLVDQRIDTDLSFVCVHHDHWKINSSSDSTERSVRYQVDWQLLLPVTSKNALCWLLKCSRYFTALLKSQKWKLLTVTEQSWMQKNDSTRRRGAANKTSRNIGAVIVTRESSTGKVMWPGKVENAVTDPTSLDEIDVRTELSTGETQRSGKEGGLVQLRKGNSSSGSARVGGVIKAVILGQLSHKVCCCVWVWEVMMMTWGAPCRARSQVPSPSSLEAEGVHPQN